MSAPAAPEPLSEAVLQNCREAVDRHEPLTSLEGHELLAEITRLRAEVARLTASELSYKAENARLWKRLGLLPRSTFGSPPEG